MPRRNRPRKNARGNSDRRRRDQSNSSSGRQGSDRGNSIFGISSLQRVENSFDGSWHVRQIVGERALKTYTCPGCLRPIPPGQPHIVAWRADWIMGDTQAGEYRRHWHTQCWRNRKQDRRG